ncbi:MAG: hypothetical protein ACK5PP_06645, partial [Acidimicrobiales bacterium]
PTNQANYRHPTNGGWYYSLCDGEFDHTLVNLEYFINYRVDAGESTGDWYLASDVDPVTRNFQGPGGRTVHADWWSGWNPEVNQMFLDNCVTFSNGQPSGCGFGYLSDGGPDGANPVAGPALKYREQYTGPEKVPADQVYADLCPGGAAPTSAAVAAYCNPGAGMMNTALGRNTTMGTGPLARRDSSLTELFCPVGRSPAAT